ncbi:Uncharacterized protein GBIM_14771 [Gryllus bimaculatus]|nr:Uncharacterized protein GBIM_14771 [Gryllus bimaculatus]
MVCWRPNCRIDRKQEAEGRKSIQNCCDSAMKRLERAAAARRAAVASTAVKEAEALCVRAPAWRARSAAARRGGGAGRRGGSGHALDENWLLSRSVPNLLLGPPSPFAYAGSGSASSPSGPSAPSPADPPSFSYLASGGHVMYLPQYEAPRDTEALAPRGRCYSAGAAGRLESRSGGGLLSKSCEDLAAAPRCGRSAAPAPSRRRRRLVARGPAAGARGRARQGAAGRARRAARRSASPSRARAPDRARRLAERLSREASQRAPAPGRAGAMRQVEEEFQRKRAREKASIRQQLRLFSLDEKLFASLPAEWQGDEPAHTHAHRADPEGAPSSSHSSAHSSGGGGGGGASKAGGSGASKQQQQQQPLAPAAAPQDLKTPSTQVLSEFREPRREYREYRPTRYIDSGPESLPHLEPKRATVHPPAVSKQLHFLNILPLGFTAYHEQGRGGGSTPRSSSSDNYRRDFAHGARPPGRSATSSDSDVSQVNGRPTSRQANSGYQHSRPLRSRSASPELERTSSSSNMEEGPDIPYKRDTSSASPTDVKHPSAENAHSTTTDGSRFRLTSLQPFVRNGKGYRPIVFNPRTPASHNIAQTVS